jgi:RNase P/RNase MRP subunit p29
MKKYADEFIGKYCEVISSTCDKYIGIKGMIVWETKYTFKILKGDKIITVLKKPCIFKIDGKIIEGNKILYKPEWRLKKFL